MQLRLTAPGLLTFALFAIQCDGVKNPTANANDLSFMQNERKRTSPNTIFEKFEPPVGYQLIREKDSSFGQYIQDLPLKSPGSKIYDHTGRQIREQRYHAAVIDMEVQNEPTLQCADIIMKLRAEYLLSRNKNKEIKFHFTSGDLYSWQQYLNGIRPNVKNNKVSFIRADPEQTDSASLNDYLQYIYMYCGTVSLAKETHEIIKPERINCGDMIISPGTPGHVVFICNIAKDRHGNRLYLLAQGFTPAQSIHILNNPAEQELNPWYSLKDIRKKFITPRYHFENPRVRSFDKK